MTGRAVESGSTIEHIEAIPFRLPMRGVLAWGQHGHLSAAEHVLLRVHLAGGAVGEAEAPPRPSIYGETLASVLGMVEYLAPRLIGLDIHDEAALARVLGSVANNHTLRGGLDMACWDARAQALGGTLFDELLGPQAQVPVSFILGIGERATMLEEARAVVAASVRVLKVKVGRDHAKDLATIGALTHEFAGSGVRLYADSNETLTPETAPAALKAMREAGLLYVEEPLPVQQLRARAKLHASGLLPIVADDSCFTPADLERELDFDTFDVLNIKPARTGFTQSLAMLERARAAGKAVMVGSQAGSGLGTLHAALLGTRSGVTEPCELSFVLKLEADLLDRPIRFAEGQLDVNTLRGAKVDLGQLARFRLR